MPNVQNVNEITQENNKNNTDTDQQNSNNNQNAAQTQGKPVVLGCDSNSNDSAVLDTVYAGLQNAGYQVTKLSIGPSPFSDYAYKSDAKGKVGVYLMADSLISYADGASDGFDFDVFVIRGGVGGGINSQEDFDTKPIGRDPDCNSACDDWAGMTYPQMNQKAQGKCVAVYGGKTPEEALQAALQGLGGQGGMAPTTTNAVTGSAVKIPDPTFYGLIKQIIGAIDGLFIIANNMAYLLAFEDFYKYRDKYKEHIPKIDPQDVIHDSIERNWSTAGYYNNIELTYSEGTLEYGHDTLIKQYGKNTYYYEFPEDDYETAKAKAQALLSAHVRDYSTDIELKIFYNENITAGSWVQLHKTLSEIKGKTRREQKQEKIIERRKGLTIADITQIIEKDKIMKHIVDEKGNEIDIESENSEYDLFFVQGYNCRWDKDNSLIMDVQLKYGPDTPDDPINATVGVGSSGSTMTAATGGQWGSDCFSIFDFCIQNNDYLMDSYSGGARVEEMKKSVNDGTFKVTSEDMQGRANQNSNYAKKYSGKSAPEVYSMFRSEYKYSLYCDNCTCWKCASDFYDNAGKTANCGDTACLLKVFFDCAGVPCIGLHIHGHYFNAIQINGTWEIIDGVRLDNQTCNFPDGNGYSSGNPCPCDSYPTGGECPLC